MVRVVVWCVSRTATISPGGASALTTGASSAQSTDPTASFPTNQSSDRCPVLSVSWQTRQLSHSNSNICDSHILDHTAVRRGAGDPVAPLHPGCPGGCRENVRLSGLQRALDVLLDEPNESRER